MKKCVVVIYITITFMLFGCAANHRATANPTKSAVPESPTPMVSVQPAATPVFSPEKTALPSTMPTPMGKWYNWDDVGSPPMSNEIKIVSDEASIYFSNADFDTGIITLYKADYDGANKEKVCEHEFSLLRANDVDCFVNYYNGWLYYSIDNILYRIRPDGTEQTHIISDEDPIDFIVVKDEIYIEGYEGLYKCDIDGKKTKLNGIGFFGYDNGYLYYWYRKEVDSPNIIAAYYIQTGEYKDIYNEGEWGLFGNFVIYHDKIYSLNRADEILCYDITTDTTKILDCSGMGQGWNIAVYEHCLLVVTDEGRIYEYDLNLNRGRILCAYCHYDNIYTTRLGVYLSWGDSIYMLESKNGKYAVVPISNT
jgi:hypothetical protein